MSRDIEAISRRKEIGLGRRKEENIVFLNSQINQINSTF